MGIWSRIVAAAGSRLRALLRRFPPSVYFEGKDYSADYHFLHLSKTQWKGVTLRMHRWMFVASPGWSAMYRVRTVAPVGWWPVESRLDPLVIEGLRRAPSTRCLNHEFAALFTIDPDTRTVSTTYSDSVGYAHALVHTIPPLLNNRGRFDCIELSPEFTARNPYFVGLLRTFGLKVSPKPPTFEGVGDRLEGFCDSADYARANAMEVALLTEGVHRIRKDSGGHLDSALAKVGATDTAAERFKRREGVLFIHRGEGAAGRFVANPEIAYPRVISLGGVVAELEGLLVDEQVSLFAHARVIAGLHGSGLANCIFAPEGAGLLELQSLDEIKSDLGTALCRSLGFDYCAVLLPGAETQTGSGRPGAVPVTDEALDVLESLVARK